MLLPKVASFLSAAGCGGGGTSFTVVGCEVLKREAEKSDE
jgi:hypothetical protein